MHRTGVVFIILGLLLAAGAATAAVPGTVTLFGQAYDVEIHSLAGTYKNGLKVTQVTDFANHANNRANKLDWVRGDASAPEKDRLFVVSAIQPGASTDAADQFYTLTGSDAATGQFNTQLSSLEPHFGGAVHSDKGGLPTDVLWLNDTDTGKKIDKNILLVTFEGDDHYRFYDLDTLDGDFLSDEVGFDESHVIRGIGRVTNPGPNNGKDASQVGDPNAPWGDVITFATSSNPDYLIATAHPKSGAGVEVGMMDLKTARFLPVLTDITAALPRPNSAAGYIHTLVPEVPRSNRYWALYSAPEPGGNGTDTWAANLLLRLQIDVPADPTTAKAGDIKATVLGMEDLVKIGLADPIASPDNAINGLVLGRFTVQGKRFVYLTDWHGNLCTLLPK